MSDDDAIVTIREAAGLVGRELATVRAWVGLKRVCVRGVRGRACLVRLGDVRKVAGELAESWGQARRKVRGPGPDATAEEVEACVAEQLRALPSWWAAESERLRGLGWKALAKGKV